MMLARLIVGFSGFLVLFWSVALLVNFPIYQETTIQGTLIHPIVDGILFFAIIVVLIAFVAYVLKTPKLKNFSMAVLGAISIIFIFVFYTIGG
ncbi:hypothetical protein [Alteribacter populi]|uniref:hypothetical protein n=1 Tax=Alteribacter populi TaxID=2011011 RepID=UPI000BBA9F01|nr:hypothetical protein [Alteribacter populi]